MNLTHLATWKQGTGGDAILVEWDGGAALVRYSAIEGMSEEQIEMVPRQVRGCEDIHTHWNDDGSIVLATGKEPVAWSEDE